MCKLSIHNCEIKKIILYIEKIQNKDQTKQVAEEKVSRIV
jgi:hypothetical protein